MFPWSHFKIQEMDEDIPPTVAEHVIAESRKQPGADGRVMAKKFHGSEHHIANSGWVGELEREFCVVEVFYSRDPGQSSNK